MPDIRFPEQLPLSGKVAEIAAVLERHQVLILCGETGSGKTTQLPKLCLQIGRGVSGTIGHTQPRRLAARSVAARIAEEIGTELGQLVGYKVRFSDHAPAGSLVKLMTDGILLAEIQHDPLLEQYDTLILDEAHERSLNIDFLLGYLCRLLSRRPDLKIIITSATIDPQRFSRHFGDAPIINVSGRTWPVEICYRPLAAIEEDARERAQTQGILDAVDELSGYGPGDILVFLAGERDIRETAEALRKHHPPETEILPLYARLGFAEQARVFRPHAGRRIVLATNVAETSLTVPGIRYVVDPGRARISRYSARSKVQRLPVEAISQASANQRAGRCGRVSAGVCIRLYSEQDYCDRPEFTDPEILRTNLAAVVLQMAHLSLGSVEEYPFIDAPEPRQISDAYNLLLNLGAVHADRSITKLGRQLATLPMDPRLARVVLAGQTQHALRETLIICAALSVQDPRERPLEAAVEADRCHARFADPKSDFVALLNLWNYVHTQGRQLSASKLRKLCKAEFLSWTRVREWRDVNRQVREQVLAMGMRPNDEPAPYRDLHQALLSGFLDQVGGRDQREGYLGPRGRRFHLFPGSGLSPRRPRWLVAAELVETSRLFARTAAAVEPEWIEQVAAHLVKRSYGNPRWEKRSSRVTADESVTLHGMELVRRRVNYARIDPDGAREIFIREALVEGHYAGRPAFLTHNRELLAEVALLETKSRRPDIMVEPEQLFAFYDERIPGHVVDGQRFERWRKETERAQPKLLFFRREHLMSRTAVEVSEQRFPDCWLLGDLRLPLNYHFDPSSDRDGVTVTLPAPLLPGVDGHQFEWLVPGLLEEKITALIRGLAKPLRKHFVPAPEFARVCVESLNPGEGRLTSAISTALQRITGVSVVEDAWPIGQLPRHLQMRYRVVDERGVELTSGRNLDQLRASISDEHLDLGASASVDERAERVSREWTFGTLAFTEQVQRGGIVMTAYPALAACEDGVGVRLFSTSVQADAAMHAGLESLIRLRCGRSLKQVARALPGIDGMCLQYRAVGSCDELRQDLITAILRQAFLDRDELPRDKAGFDALTKRGLSRLDETIERLCPLLQDVLSLFHELNRDIKAPLAPAVIPLYSDLRSQLDRLVHTRFVASLPLCRLENYPRYLRGMKLRLQKLRLDPGRDRQRYLRVVPHWHSLLEKLPKGDAPGETEPELERYRWLLEEFRISVFAQELGTAEPVSEKRLAEHWRAVG